MKIKDFNFINISNIKTKKMEILICFIVHVLLIVTIKEIATRIKNIKAKQVLCVILLIIVPFVLWESILGYNTKHRS